MKALIVCSQPSTQLALERQLQRRGQTFASFAPSRLDDLAGELAGAAEDSIGLLPVLDAASRELNQEGSEGFPAAAFQQLVERCRQHEVPLLMLSDSRVFPGALKQRYREIDTPAPAPGPGALLLERERYLAQHCPRHVILRTGPLLAPSGANLLTDLVQAFRRGGVVPVAAEPRFCPTPVADVARVVSGILDQLDCAAACWGIYHYHSSDAASCYEFAEVVLAAAAQYWDVGGSHVQLQASVAETCGGVFPVLSCQRIRDTFGIQQLPWRSAVPHLLKQLYEGEMT